MINFFNLVSTYFHIIFFLLRVYFCRKKPMTAAAFSADGSVLAVAAERVITLWDPDRNVLVATIGESFEVNYLSMQSIIGMLILFVCRQSVVKSYCSFFTS